MSDPFSHVPGAPRLNELPLFRAGDDLASVSSGTSDAASLPWRSGPPAAPLRPARRGADAAPFGAAKYDARQVDWGLVRVFRQRASQVLAEQLRSRPGVDEEDRRELGRSIIRSLLGDHARPDVLDGVRLMELDAEQALASAIFDSLFGLGRLQPLVDLPDVENIEITGHDSVLLLYADGRQEIGPPVADSDEELIEFLAFLAAQRGGGERTFSTANPVLHLNLGGRARLAAIMEVSQRPVVRIRKHLLPNVTLPMMTRLGTI